MCVELMLGVMAEEDEDEVGGVQLHVVVGVEHSCCGSMVDE